MMELKIQFDRYKVLQYIMIWLMFISSRATIYAQYKMTFVYIMIGLCIVISAYMPEVRNQAMYIVFFLIFGSLLLTRWINGGGYGFSFWIISVSTIWVTYVAYMIDTEMFLTRFVRLITFFASISLIMWVLCFIMPNFMQSILVMESTFFKGTKGMLLYTFRYATWSTGDTRNVGIFTEPGIYQIALNSAIFAIFFMRKKIHCDDRYVTRALIVLVLALLSSQSTTGFLSLGFIILGYLLMREKSGFSIHVGRIVVVGTIIVLINYMVSGENSILYTAVIGKMFSDAGQVDLNASSGYWRMNGITNGWQIFLQHPLGAGDSYSSLYNSMSEDIASGAGITTILATCGIITFGLYCYFMVYIAAKRIKKLIPFLVYMAMWINTGLSQAEIVYACIFCLALVGIESGYEDTIPADTITDGGQ